MSSRCLCSLLALLTACTAAEELPVDASASIDSPSDAAIDTPSCTTDGKIYVVEGATTSVRITQLDGISAQRTEGPFVTCSAAPTALGVLRNGDTFLALEGGAIAKVTATGCSPITVSPAPSADLALVGVDNTLVALERTSGKLWRIDPGSGTATSLSTIAGVTAKTSLAGGELGLWVYIPAPLVGQGKLIPIDANGTQGTAVSITGGSTTQATADWVGVVGDASKLWMAASGYYGAGGARRTIWMALDNNEANTPAYEYYSSTVAVSAPTCP